MPRPHKTPPAPNSSGREATTSAKAMPALWGSHAKMIARPSDRARIQRFYKEALGCDVGEGPQHPGGPQDTDLIRFANKFVLVVHYDDSALSDSDHKKAIWLEIQTDDPDEMKKRIQAFGVQGFDYFDQEHFYFQAPGGQVFRVAKK